MSKQCDIMPEVIADGIVNRVRNIKVEIDAVRVENPDGVHDLRVASRRMRAALQEYAPFLGAGRTKKAQDGLRAITRYLGLPRELDVMIEMLIKERAETAGSERIALNYALRRVRARRRRSADDCTQALEIVEAPDFERQFFTLLTTVPSPARCSLRKGSFQASKRKRNGPPCLLAHARASLLEKCKRLHATYRLWLSSGEENALHQLRIAFKKFRYACEVHQPHYGEAMTAFLGELKQTQQHLGDWNDCRVLRDELAAIAESAPPRSGQGLPGLIERFARRAAALEQAFAVAAELFFSEPRRDAIRRLLASPQDSRCRMAAFQPDQPNLGHDSPTPSPET